MLNKDIIKLAAEITTAKMTNAEIYVTKETGEDTADFMESIYRKIVELDKNADSNGYPKE